MSPDRILLVEDDCRVRRELRAVLIEQGFCVLEADGVQAARRQLTEDCALMLLDVGLPDGSGVGFCQELRAAGHQTPVIMLTAQDAPRDRIKGLEAGADDYVVKPFEIDEVLARIRSVLRRARRGVDQQFTHDSGLWADAEAREAGRGDRRIEFTPREFDLLLFLLRHPGRAWTRDQLLERVWGIRGGIGSSRTIDLHIRKLRQKIGDDDGESRVIATVWGVGYRLNEGQARA